MRTRLYKGDHPSVALSLSNLALVLQDLGKPGDAEPLLRDALTVYKRLYKGDHPSVALGLNNLAAVFVSQNRSEDAEPLLRDALDMYQRLVQGRPPIRRDGPEQLGTRSPPTWIEWVTRYRSTGTRWPCASDCSPVTTSPWPTG